MMRLTKREIRSKILKILKTQKEEDQNRKSANIGSKLFRNKLFKRAKIVMFYVSFGGEVNTNEMIKAAQKLGKIVVVPVCRKNRIIKACLFSPGLRLERGPYGILEPVVRQCVNLEYLDLVIVPGVAFDKHGNRLGRGRGYYDRFLSRLSAKTATFGLAFDFQILPSIPTTFTDVSVDRVISN